jgi:hypothetical protein
MSQNGRDGKVYSEFLEVPCISMQPFGQSQVRISNFLHNKLARPLGVKRPLDHISPFFSFSTASLVRGSEVAAFLATTAVAVASLFLPIDAADNREGHATSHCEN